MFAWCSYTIYQQGLMGTKLTCKTLTPWPQHPVFLIFGNVAAYLNSLHSIMLISGIEEGKKKYKPFLFILLLPLY